MNKSKILVLLAAPALLCGCAKKVTFSEFVKAVSEIKLPEDKEMTEGRVKGTVTIDGTETKIDETINEENMEKCSAEGVYVFLLMASNHVALYAIVEDKNATYYAGSSFKVEAEGLKMEWDSYGYCTKIAGEFSVESQKTQMDVSCSYTWSAAK